jgi:surface protein
MDFKNLKNDTIELDLSKIFNENGYINYNDEIKYKENKHVKKIILFCSSNLPIKIDNWFLSNCPKLTSLDISGFKNVTSIGDYFLTWCKNITSLDTSEFYNITSIGNFFLTFCKSITLFNTVEFKNITSIGYFFLTPRNKNLSVIVHEPSNYLNNILNGLQYNIIRI